MLFKKGSEQKLDKLGFNRFLKVVKGLRGMSPLNAQDIVVVFQVL